MEENQSEAVLLRIVREVKVSQAFKNVYGSLIQSILAFNIAVWFGHLTLTNINKLSRVVKTAVKLIGRQRKTLDELYSSAVYGKAQAIIKDNMHLLYKGFDQLPSRWPYRIPLTGKKIYKSFSFIPNALNKLL